MSKQDKRWAELRSRERVHAVDQCVNCKSLQSAVDRDAGWFWSTKTKNEGAIHPDGHSVVCSMSVNRFIAHRLRSSGQWDQAFFDDAEEAQRWCLTPT